jgi:hypothetical protein
MNASFATFPRFSGLPIEEKRELILSRFQQIRGKDYKVVDFYLLPANGSNLASTRSHRSNRTPPSA